MTVATLKTSHAPETDRLLEEGKSLSEWTAWEKIASPCREEAVPAKCAVNEGIGFMTAMCGSYGFSATSPAKFDLDLDSQLPPPMDAGAIWKIVPGATGCVSVADMLRTLGVVEQMEAKPTKTEDSPMAGRLREVRSAPELYPDLDLDRIRARAAELRAASSDSEAISMVLGRSVQIVVHDDE